MLPDLTEAVSESEKRIRDQMPDLFDGVFQRMDRLEMEYHALSSAVGRIERRMGSPDAELEESSIQEQIRVLRQRFEVLQRRLDELESTR